MDECSEDVHEHIQCVSDDEDEHNDDGAEDDIVRCQTCGEAVEDGGEDASGESEGKQTHVGQHITQHAGGCVVGIPEAGADVDEQSGDRVLAVAFRTVVAECERKSGVGEPAGGGCIVGQEHRGREGEDNQNPTDGAQGVGEAELDGAVVGFEDHTEDNLYESEDEREVEELAVLQMGHAADAIEERHTEIIEVEAEERSGEESAKHGRDAHGQQQVQCCPHALSHVFLEELDGEYHQGDEESVAGVSETESEEENVEGSKEGREVEFVILREHVELGNHLEESEEAVVLQAYGDVIAWLGIGNLVPSCTIGESGRDIGLLVGRDPSSEYHEMVVRCGLGSGAHIVEGEALGELVAQGAEVGGVGIGEGAEL